MRVEEPEPIIPMFDRDNYELAVYVRRDHWGNYKWLKGSIEAICAAVGIDVASPHLQELTNQLLSWASAAVGMLEIRLTLVALAIHALRSQTLVKGYQVVSTPGWPYSFPIVFGEEGYGIELLD
ncbi:hypothetical protein [Halorubrum trueperi]|uniref:Uncharacterized protein n=1 Tax=Halorubrum trueperi TaxID=2004704 RepID=A0ABD5UM12_9EURY